MILYSQQAKFVKVFDIVISKSPDVYPMYSGCIAVTSRIKFHATAAPLYCRVRVLCYRGTPRFRKKFLYGDRWHTHINTYFQSCVCKTRDECGISFGTDLRQCNCVPDLRYRRYKNSLTDTTSVKPAMDATFRSP